MDLLALLRSAADVSARGQLRRLIPSAALVFLVAGLFAAGAPQAPPRFASAVTWADGVKGVQLGLLILAVASASVFLQPLLGFLAGGLQGSRVFLPAAVSAVLIQRRASQLYRDRARWDHLMHSSLADASATSTQLAELGAVEKRLRQSPSRIERVGPTRLSGMLKAADERVFERYGLDAAIAIPRLRALAPERTVAAFDEGLDDLRFATDLTSALLLGAIASIVLLALHPGYLWLPAVILVLAWVSYRNALTAAARFGEAQLVLFDLHRFVLYDTLQRARPPSPSAEYEAGRRLTVQLWRGDDTDKPYVQPAPRPSAVVQGEHLDANEWQEGK